MAPGAGLAGGARSLAGRAGRGRSPPSSRAKVREGMDLLVAAGGDAVVCFLLGCLGGVRDGRTGSFRQFVVTHAADSSLALWVCRYNRKKPGPSRKSAKATGPAEEK